jgi:hypothetical protein
VGTTSMPVSQSSSSNGKAPSSPGHLRLVKVN